MHILIVEDEQSSANWLLRLCKDLLGDKIHSISHQLTFDDAEEYISEHPIDLLFLDLNLNGEDGFDLLKKAVANSFHTIIVSAYADKAIKAFEYGVLDFIPKPYGKERLRKAIDRLDNQQSKSSTQYFSIKKPSSIELITIDTIKYIKGSGNYSDLHTNDNKTHLHDKNLEKIAVLLPDSFYRIHKSYIVNLCNISHIANYPGSKYELILKTGEVLPVGRSRVKELRKKIGII